MRNLIVRLYATPNGERYFRKEQALTSSSDDRPTTAAVDADPENLGDVTAPEERERYTTAAERMAAECEPDDTA